MPVVRCLSQSRDLACGACSLRWCSRPKVIGERPIVGICHACVFWGFVAFAGYTAVQFLKGLGIADLTGERWFRLYALGIVPFAVAVLVGILALLVRRVAFRPPALGETLSVESVVIGLFIAILMVTFLLELRLTEGLAARVNWWVHVLVILVFLSLIPGSKHLHLLLSPLTILVESPSLGTIRNLDFEKEEVGFETVKDLERKQVLDAFTCVECGRCQDNCPAHGTGKPLSPKQLILRNEDALLAGRRDTKLADVYDAGVLWQCTTCGACEYQLPGRDRAPPAHRGRSQGARFQRGGGGLPRADVQQPRTAREHLGLHVGAEAEVRGGGRPGDLRCCQTRVPAVARLHGLV